ncbi:MAG: YtxH domain-containing protein [Dehalococcoidia bacterium]
MGQNRRGSGFFSGLIIGTALGAIAGLFLSQKSEKDTVGGKMRDLIARGRENIREAIEEGKATAARKEAEYQAGFEKEEDE